MQSRAHAEDDLDDAPTGEAKGAPKVVTREAIEKVLLPIAAAHHCEIVSFDFRREPIGWVLRVYVENLGHDPRKAIGGVTLETCAKISRDVSTTLDVVELIDHAYNLEVSSPGLNRPLSRREDYARFVGVRAEVQLREPIAAYPKRKVFRGELLALRDGASVELREDDLGEVTLPFDGIGKAHLVVDVAKPSPKPGKQKKHRR